MVAVQRDVMSTTADPMGPSLDAWLAMVSARTQSDLSVTALGALLHELALHPGLRHRSASLRPAEGRRAWESVWRDAHIDLWLIVWAGDADTGWHDHDTSSGAFRVLEGTMVEERPRWSGEHRSVAVPSGEGMTFGPEHVHRLNSSGERALTLHAYSPPLLRLGQYETDDDGVVRRRSIGWEEELRAESVQGAAPPAGR